MMVSSSSMSNRVRWVGIVAGPLLACAVYFGSGWASEADVAADRQAARSTAAVAMLMACWWMTEAVPLPITSLLPLILFPLTDVLSVDAAAAPYANKYVFLFMGGFMIARAVEKWNLHRRIALLTVLSVGTQPTRLVGGFMLSTACLSMWISNTASTAMMLPIGLSLVSLIQEHLAAASDHESSSTNFATCLMLGIAYSASIGGLGTLIGTPTNLLLAGFASKNGISLGFGQWMLFATPLAAIFLLLAWLLMTRFIFPIRVRDIPGGRALIRQELLRLGPVSRGEWTVLAVFVATGAAWVLREPLTNWDWLVARFPIIQRLDDTIIALLGASVLFLLPVDARRGTFALDWPTAVTIPWGLLLLFGGGFCLAKAFEESGLAEWIGNSVQTLDVSPVVLMVVVTTMIVFLTELTSNTPTAATFLPILYGVAEGMHVHPMWLLVPTTLAATCAFMLPVATPPNAIVFGSGHIEIRQMVRAGIWLNLVSIALISVWMWLVGSRIFGISSTGAQ